MIMITKAEFYLPDNLSEMEQLLFDLTLKKTLAEFNLKNPDLKIYIEGTDEDYMYRTKLI